MLFFGARSTKIIPLSRDAVPPEAAEVKNWDVPSLEMLASPQQRTIFGPARYALLLAMVARAGALFAQTPQQQAWGMLRVGVNQKSTATRTQAVRMLGLLAGDPEATKMAQTALEDRKPEVRVAAATALGQMGSEDAIPGLEKALFDRKLAVVLAAAHALQILNDPAGYQIYYQLLTGERKSAEGLIGKKIDTVENRKKRMELVFDEGIRFVPLPFVGYGLSAAKAIQRDDASPVRAAAAGALVNDLDPRVSQALIRAISDKSWTVRASALVAIANRKDSNVVNAIVPALSDKNQVVRFTAAAAVIRLTTVAARNNNFKNTSNVVRKESKPTQDQCEAALSRLN